jgi:hypothetical protein
MAKQGNTMEIGQALTNLYGLNPDITVHLHITSQGVRQTASKLVTPNLQPQYEAVTIIFLVYTNPGGLKGFNITPININQEDGPVKAKLLN